MILLDVILGLCNVCLFEYVKWYWLFCLRNSFLPVLKSNLQQQKMFWIPWLFTWSAVHTHITSKLHHRFKAEQNQTTYSVRVCTQHSCIVNTVRQKTVCKNTLARGPCLLVCKNWKIEQNRAPPLTLKSMMHTDCIFILFTWNISQFNNHTRPCCYSDFN